MSKNKYDFVAEPKFTEVLLNKIQHRVTVRFPKYNLLQMRIEQYTNVIQNELYYTLEYYLLGMEKEEKKSNVVSFPKDWWQAFKIRFFPKWLLEIYPPLMHKDIFNYTFHKTSVCPHLNLPPTDSMHVSFLYTEGISHDR